MLGLWKNIGFTKKKKCFSAVRSLGSFPEGECDSDTRPKDAFDGPAQEKSPCADNVNGGLVDGLVEGRTGVQVERVESEVVVICDGNNKEGACDMLCWDVKIECSMRDTTLHAVLSREALEPHEKKSRVRKCQMRVLMRVVRVWCSDSPSRTRESPLPVSATPCFFFLKKKIYSRHPRRCL